MIKLTSGKKINKQSAPRFNLGQHKMSVERTLIREERNHPKINYDQYVTSDSILLLNNKNREVIGKMSKEEGIEESLKTQENLIEIFYDNVKWTSVCIIERLQKFIYNKSKKKKSISNQVKSKEFKVATKSDLSDIIRQLTRACDMVIKDGIIANISLKSFRGDFQNKEKLILCFLDEQKKIKYNALETLETTRNKNLQVFFKIVLKRNKSLQDIDKSTKIENKNTSEKLDNIDEENSSTKL